MGALIHNQLIHLSSPQWEGLYRVVLDIPQDDITVIVRVQVDDAPDAAASGAPGEGTAVPQKKPPLPFVGTLIWASRSELEELAVNGSLKIAEFERDNINSSDSARGGHWRRREVMSEFLNFKTLREAILEHGSLGGLVKAAKDTHNVSRFMIYKCWSLMCRYGFSGESLMPRHDRRGAPGVARHCDPGGREKPGRKTLKQRLATVDKIVPSPDQPGMSSVWEELILIADKKIKGAKPTFTKRYDRIVVSMAPHLYKEADGSIVKRDLVLGEYPNKGQVRRVLNSVPKLERLRQGTTQGHFDRTNRGMNGTAWEGVAGPGHTWAIDSTIGDIYLRSSVNRAWIIGRPIVYIMVDVWSTAVVGFYVCLRGPSWAMAKLALFCAAAPPELIADLWRYEPVLSLSPAPTLPDQMMCDRGEYLSQQAKFDAAALIPGMSYAPPYRPDMKGLVEVLHRIKKDQQYGWVPGAIDARRKEYDLRKFNPHTGVFTIAEYTEYLTTVFASYNLAADRNQRIDAHMASQGVFPSPAGLWRWGHEVGLGVSREMSLSYLKEHLLPAERAIITQSGVRFAGRHYESQVSQEQQWTAYARNFGAQKIDIQHFPGSVSRIWTPFQQKAGLLELTLSEQSTASPELTDADYLDSIMFHKSRAQDRAHDAAKVRFAAVKKTQGLIAAAKAKTAEAIAVGGKNIPSSTEARALETNTADLPSQNPPLHQGASRHDEAEEEHRAMLRELYEIADAESTR